MRKSVLTITVIMSMASSALAQYSDYQATSDKLTICRSFGQRAQVAYLLKQKGEPKPSAGPMSYTISLRQYAVDYGYDHAADQVDANRNAWSYCMDNLDRITRDEQARIRSR